MFYSYVDCVSVFLVGADSPCFVFGGFGFFWLCVVCFLEVGLGFLWCFDDVDVFVDVG